MTTEPLEATAVIWYVWTCPECGEVQEAEPPDVDPTGETLTCRDCGVEVEITGSPS